MRLLLLAAAAFISFCSVPAQAQRAPYDMWCRDERIGPGPFDTVMRCEAYTYQQCMASRTSFGACSRYSCQVSAGVGSGTPAFS